MVTQLSLKSQEQRPWTWLGKVEQPTMVQEDASWLGEWCQDPLKQFSKIRVAGSGSPFPIIIILLAAEISISTGEKQAVLNTQPTNYVPNQYLLNTQMVWTVVINMHLQTLTNNKNLLSTQLVIDTVLRLWIHYLYPNNHVKIANIIIPVS